MSAWLIWAGCLAALLVLCLALPRIAARIPPKHDGDGGIPHFPGWMVRCGPPALVFVAAVSIACAASPNLDLSLWSLAGPWAMSRFARDVSLSTTIVVSCVLIVGMAAYPIRPCRLTAVILLVAGASWFGMGFGAVRMGV